MRYRGVPTNVDVSIGMAFAGHMCIELITQHDDQPSVIQDVIAARGYGFHHFGIGTLHFENLHNKQSAAGYDAIFTVEVVVDTGHGFLRPPVTAAQMRRPPVMAMVSPVM